MRLPKNRPIDLSRRQSQFVGLLVQGLKNKEIAASMKISEGTGKAYLTTLFEKVDAKGREPEPKPAPLLRRTAVDISPGTRGWAF